MLRRRTSGEQRRSNLRLGFLLCAVALAFFVVFIVEQALRN
jgi:hypothetical protein